MEIKVSTSFFEHTVTLQVHGSSKAGLENVTGPGPERGPPTLLLNSRALHPVWQELGLWSGFWIGLHVNCLENYGLTYFEDTRVEPGEVPGVGGTWGGTNGIG